VPEWGQRLAEDRAKSSPAFLRFHRVARRRRSCQKVTDLDGTSGRVDLTIGLAEQRQGLSLAICFALVQNERWFEFAGARNDADHAFIVRFEALSLRDTLTKIQSGIDKVDADVNNLFRFTARLTNGLSLVQAVAQILAKVQSL
jgi:hypothetical protein